MKPTDHNTRMQRALLSFDGLSVGDAFGECFFTSPTLIHRRLEHRDPPPAPWFITDDSTMALSIVRALQRDGQIHQDALATAFAQEYARDPRHGYGGMAREILRASATEHVGQQRQDACSVARPPAAVHELRLGTNRGLLRLTRE